MISPRWMMLLLCAPLCAVAASAPRNLKTEQDKVAYALGLLLSQNLQAFELTPRELEMAQVGLADGVQGRTPAVSVEAYQFQMQALRRTRVALATERETKAGQVFLEQAAAEKEAQRSDTGLVMRTLQAGTGPKPTAEDQVRVHYTGTLADGKVFDSSRQRNEPAVFAVKNVIPCWTEALQRMQVGGRARLVCPAALAYGDRGAGADIKPGATLVFDVELLEIVSPQAGGPPVR